MKNWRLVVLLDQKCKREKSWIAMELECMKTVLKKCHAFSETPCFLKAIAGDSHYCSKVFLRQSCHANGDCSSYKLWCARRRRQGVGVEAAAAASTCRARPRPLTPAAPSPRAQVPDGLEPRAAAPGAAGVDRPARGV